MSLAARPLPTKDDAVAYAREMVPRAKWPSIAIEEGSTDDGGPGLIMKAWKDCWIITYDPSASEKEKAEERIWVAKETGVVVKMVLDD